MVETELRGGAIVCFYASSKHGSEYRSGIDFIEIAWRQGFDLAVVSDIAQNDERSVLEGRFPGLTVLVVPSAVRSQRLLYRFTDLVPQLIWHRRVSAALRQRSPRPQRLWIANSAQPWLPLDTYSDCFSERLIWGPVGGGGRASARFLSGEGLVTRLRERLRAGVEHRSLRAKVGLLSRWRRAGRSVEVIARTREVGESFAALGVEQVAVIPEIVEPLKSQTIRKAAVRQPRLIWVGQDIPRKNLSLGLELFSRLRAAYFPDLTLDVFGIEAGADQPGVRYHGWTPGVPWGDFRDGGVLLLTSYREGLPSVVLEALSQGLACVSTKVGAIETLLPAPLFLIPMQNYPDVDDTTLQDMAKFMEDWIGTTLYELASINHEKAISSVISKRNDQ